jgi:hypothetical protein
MIQEKQQMQKKFEQNIEDLKSEKKILSSRSRLQTNQLEGRIRDLERALIDSEFQI